MTTAQQHVLAASCAVLAVLVGGCGDGPADAAPEQGPRGNRRNVLLVTLDTTRADYLGSHGAGHAAHTPNLDALAADGLRFSRCMAQSGATPISHASILTGLYPFDHGVRVIYARSGYRLADDVDYLPALLQDEGYATAAFLSSFTVSEFFGFERGFDRFDSGLTRDASKVINKERGGSYIWALAANQRRSDATTDEALEWLRGRDPASPFFLWVHYWDPHDGNPAARNTLPPPAFLDEHVKRGKALGLDRRRAIYAAEVAYVDLQFGRLIAGLREAGSYDDTVIVVVADHGQGLMEHGWWHHRLLYEEQLHIPLLVRVPGWPTAGTVDAHVRSVDVYSSVLDALDLAGPAAVEGLSLRGLAEGRAEEPRLGYAEALNRFDLNSIVAAKRPADGNLYSVSDGTWKLIFRLDAPDESELYHLGEDPDEAVNRYRTETAQAARLRAVLDGYGAYRTEPFPEVGEGATPEDIEALRGLGYVGGGKDEGAAKSKD